MSYQLLKMIHILSAKIMIGTGLGSAFYLFMTYKRGSVQAIKEVVKLVVLADTVFTFPSVVIQIITGIGLAERMNLTYSKWFWVVIGKCVGFWDLAQSRFYSVSLAQNNRRKGRADARISPTDVALVVLRCSFFFSVDLYLLFDDL